MIGPARPSRPARRGASLVEVALSTIVLAFVVVGALRVLVGVTERRALIVRTTLGESLADEMLAAVMSRPFYAEGVIRASEWGPSATEQSADAWGTFDDCDDFDGWSASPPEEPDGDPLKDFEGWGRSVSVDWVSLTTLESTASPEVKRVRVQVSYQGKVIATRTGFRTVGGQNTVEPR